MTPESRRLDSLAAPHAAVPAAASNADQGQGKEAKHGKKEKHEKKDKSPGKGH